MDMRFFKKVLIFSLLTLLAIPGVAQNPTGGQAPTFDNFLDEDDFDGPPGAPKAANPPKARMNNTESPATPPAFPGAFSGNGFGGGDTSGGSFKGAKPTPRRNRKESTPAVVKKSIAEATDKDITNENFPDLIDSFDYPNAEITDVVKAISELTGKNFIVDPVVKGKITIIAPSRITVAEAYKAFLSALAINGFTLVPSGKFLKVKPADKALKDNIDLYAGGFSPNTDNIITRIIQLRYISAKDVMNSLGQILKSRLGEVNAYEPTNTLILSDYGSNIERVMKIIKQLDVPGFEEQLEVIRVRYAKASELSKVVDQIINKGKTNPNQGGGFSTGIPRFNTMGGTTTGTAEAYSLVIPDERTNTLIVVGNTQGIDKIRKLVRKLDFKINPEDAGGVNVYYVRFGDAEKIAQTLQGLAQASTSTSTANPFGAPSAPVKTNIFSGDVKIVADKTTNSLVVTASKQDYDVIKAILTKLDVARNQVYVEAIIMELNVSTLKQWGINYYNLIANNTYAGRSGFAGGGQGQFFNPADDKGGIISFAAGGGVKVTPPGGTEVTIPSLVGFINFLSSITDTNILSTPQIMALDNEEAEIEVGDDVPVGTSTNSTTTTGQTTSQVRAKLTTKLNIKPHISPGSDTMRLEITQNIAGVSGQQINAKALADSAIATTTRNTKTNVIVHDGDTIVLGGLMKDEQKTTVVKVPLLGDIPILGWLFKSKRVELAKTNLMMFLTPKIIRNADVSNSLLSEKMRERVNYIEKNLAGKDVQGENVDALKLEKNGKVQELK